MKYTLSKPRKLATGKAAPYWGVRVRMESAYEDQAAQQLYPTLGKSPKGRETKAKGLADLCKEINAAKDKAKDEAKFNKEQIDKLEATRSKLAGIVQDKAEERSVECVDQYNFREKQVQSVRLDTGVVIATRAMEPVEYQEEMDLHVAANAVPFAKTAEA